MIALLGSTVMADGEMGSGGTPCTANCPAAAISGSTTTQGDSATTSEVTDVVIVIIEEYLLFRY